MNLVDEEDDFAVGLIDFADDALQSLLEFTFVFGAGNKCTHVQREEGLGLQVLGDVAANNTVCDAFGNGGLADARFADKDRVVLGATAKNLQHTADFVVTADDRVEFAALCQLVEVASILAQGVESILGGLAAHLAAFAEVCNGGTESLVADARVFQQTRSAVVAADKSDEEMLDRDELVAHLRSGLLCLDKCFVEVVACILAASTDARQRLHMSVESLRETRHVDLHFPQQVGGHVLILGKHALQQMHRVDARMLVGLRNLGCLLYRFLCFDRKIIQVHGWLFYFFWKSLQSTITPSIQP